MLPPEREPAGFSILPPGSRFFSRWASSALYVESGEERRTVENWKDGEKTIGVEAALELLLSAQI